MIDIFLLVFGFAIFVLLQAAFINGMYDFMKGYMDSGKAHGNLGYLLFHEFIEKHDDKVWAKPIFSCVKCMSSFWGAVTFFPPVIMLFGFHWNELIIFFYDVIILVFLNFFLFKKT